MDVWHHRAVGSTEHDPSVSAYHGYCRICAVPWPCEAQVNADAAATRLAALDAEAKLAAMQRVVEAAVAYFDAEYAVRRTLSDKAETDEEAEAVCAALKVEGDAHEAMFDAVRAYKEASRG